MNDPRRGKFSSNASWRHDENNHAERSTSRKPRSFSTFYHRAARNAVDPEGVLGTVSLNLSSVEQEGTSMRVMVVHQFVENCAKAANYIAFSAQVGAKLDSFG